MAGLARTPVLPEATPAGALSALLQRSRPRTSTPDVAGCLTRLLTTIPSEAQREGLSLSSLQASLRGRSRGNCHPGELGQALRRLGFQRQRDWSGADGFRAIWRKAA
jgi:hypothetical protein